MLESLQDILRWTMFGAHQADGTPQAELSQDFSQSDAPPMEASDTLRACEKQQHAIEC